MLEQFKDKQKLFYDFITNSVSNKKVSHAYLIETNGVDYGFDLALSLAKYFLCDENNNCNNCNKCKQIDLNNYPDLIVIDAESSVIKKEQILDLQNKFLTKPLYGKYRIYIIKDASLLNKSSANTILRFLEEPDEDIIAILLTDNIYNVIDTIISRCKIISLVNKDALTTVKIMKQYINDEDFDNFYKENLDLIVNFFVELEKKGTKILIEDNVYYFKDKLKMLFEIGIYLYNDILNILLEKDIENFSSYEKQLKEIIKLNTIDDIIRKIDLFNQFLEDVNYNVNKELFINNFVISMGGNLND